MSSAQKERLIDCIVRLHQTEQGGFSDGNIEMVREELERILGPTTGRAMASRLLGVSQTALDRWVASGDIPTVIGPTGRREVPLEALVELVSSVRRRRAEAAEPHPLASVLRERRAQAQGLDTTHAIRPALSRDRHGHSGPESRALAYHRALASRLDEKTVHGARRRLRRWLSEGRIDPRNGERWEDILSQPPATISKLISQDSQRARQLRQSSPFAGTLSEPERDQLLAALAERQP